MSCNRQEPLFLNTTANPNFLGTFVANQLNPSFKHNQEILFSASQSSLDWEWRLYDNVDWRKSEIRSEDTIKTTKLVGWFYNWLSKDFPSDPSTEGLPSPSPEQPSGLSSHKALVGILCKQIAQLAKELDWDIPKQITRLAASSWLSHLREDTQYRLSEEEEQLAKVFQSVSSDNSAPPPAFFSLSFRSLTGLAAYLLDHSLIKLALVRAGAENLTNTNLIRQIWQEEYAEKIRSALGLGSFEDSADLLPFLQIRAAQHAAEGDRARHRHGACLYLRVEMCVELTEDEKLKEKLNALTVTDRLLSLGRNTEVYTRGWKRLNAESKKDDAIERWKIIHAEVAALINAVRHPLIRRVLLSESGAEDFTWAQLTDDESLACLSPAMLQCLELMSAKEGVCWKGCLGVVVAELDDNRMHFCPSQACPLCVKALKRWGIGAQTYTSGTAELLKTEGVVWKPEIVCESLRSALVHFASSPAELPRKKRKSD